MAFTEQHLTALRQDKSKKNLTYIAVGVGAALVLAIAIGGYAVKVQSDKAAALQTVAAGLGLAKPLVCTESGLTSSPDPRFQAPGWPVGSEEVQSRFLVRMYAEGLGAGVRSITWFRLRDPATGPRPWEVFRMTGLLRDDASPKPAFTAYQTLVREVADRPFLRRLDAAALGTADATGYAFGGAAGEVWVVWSRTDSPAVVAPGGAAGARAYDMLGAAVPLKGGALPVGPNPVYLEIPAGR